MLILKTGRPGHGKTLNTIKAVCTEQKFRGRKKFYNNIRLMLLDYEQCKTFAAYFYDIYLGGLTKAEKKVLEPTLNHVHEQKRLATLEDFPFLEIPFNSHNPLQQWLKWVRRCYSKQELKKLTDLQKQSGDDVELTFQDYKSLNLHWEYFENPHEWFNMPAKSVLIIDEAQEYFPVRSAKEKVPEYSSRFEKHRHDSFDVILVTQHPMFLDIHLRRLTGEHTQFFNFWASKRITVYKWDKCVDPDDRDARKDSRKMVIKRPSDFYGVYHSAFEHTHKMSIPKIVYIVPFLVIIFFSVLFYIYNTLNSTEDEGVEEDQSSLNFKQNLASKLVEPDIRQSPESYLEKRKPRLAGLEYTAPQYDHLTKPKSYPKPKNCVIWHKPKGDQCVCYSQRATRMDVPKYLCESIVVNGYFDNSISDKEFSRQKFNRMTQNNRNLDPELLQKQQHKPVNKISTINFD